ncbi:hypothetical protein CNR22_12165 [Sphingobacteriaceae bacterium]|nr:hypothetical protein CNR22_12165 [Sphingobacteriaceae bacterium]
MRSGLRPYTKLVIIFSFVISAGLVLFIAVNANRHLSVMSGNTTDLNNAYRVLELLEVLTSDVNIIDAKQNAYLRTSDPQILNALNIKETEVKSNLKSIGKYFSGRAEEEKFYLLKELTFKKLQYTKDLAGSNNSATLRTKRKAAMVDLGTKNTLNEISTLMHEIDSSLSYTTQSLIDRNVNSVKVSRNWGILEVVLGVIVLFVSLLLLLRDLNIRNKLEAELLIAKNQADDNSMMQEQFMANMSHEIRTPMNAILGFADLLQKTNLDRKQSEYISAIRASGSNLLNIVNDILDFSKIEAGKLTIEKIAFNLESLIGSLRIMFSEKARQKNIQFEVSMDSNLPEMIFGDPTRLTQILVNLINNAIKFTDVGVVKISCELKSIEHDMAQVVFRVKDTGIGIPQDKLDIIFERFNQGNRETTRRYGGTGLGLSIVRDLVELQNGEIRVKSKQNSGSEFIVTLSYPISYETHIKITDNSHTRFPSLSGKNLSVLLVEDNELNQKLARSYLQGFGLEVDLAENGAVAIEKLQEKKFDLVLMDIQMPVLDGYNAAQKIRYELQMDIPIIAMTAHIMSGEKEKCISYGMNDYISKPFKEADLYEIVSSFLKIEKQVETKPPLVETSIRTHAGVVDFKDIEDMSRGNRSFIIEMITLFLEKNPLDIAEVDAAIKTRDLSAVRAISHRMKTSVGFMGLKHLGKILGEMEIKAETDGEIKEISSLFNKVVADCKKARSEFEIALETTYK